MRSLLNSGFLAIILIAVIGAGHYATDVKQPAELQKIDDTIKLASLERVEISRLLVEQASSRDLAAQSLARWKSRYKEIPETLNTAEMVLYLEGLTSSGFEKFDIDLRGVKNESDFMYYTFKVTAMSTFSQMYHFIWHIENNREFYRINDLKTVHKTIYKLNSETNVPKRYDRIEFSFTLDAYFGAKYGIAASEDELVEVPSDLLPNHDASHNSFFPLIRTDLPPNDELLLDIEKATLVSVVGDKAIFEAGDYSFIVQEGERIYLGKILAIDSRTATVRVEQNKGGKVFTIDLKVDVNLIDTVEQPGVQVSPAVQN